MSNRTNAAAVMESLEVGAGSGSAVVRSFVSLTSFAQAATSSEVLSGRPGVDDLLAAVSAAISAADQVMEAVSQWRSHHKSVPVHDQFQILFYATCQRAYLQSLGRQLKNVKQEQPDGAKAPEHSHTALTQLAKEISDAGVTYILCVDPNETELPLFDAYDRWLTAVLPSYGISTFQAYELVREVHKSARKGLKTFLSQQTSDAAWMRDYLALSRRETSTQVHTTFTAVSTSLNEWTAHYVIDIKKRHQAAWSDYRKTLGGLPDQSDSMFAETFGVRKVFIAPQGSYMVIGMSTKSYMVNNVPRLLGALISERIPVGDLRILCGGPGSGKSTVCRMLASELAKDETMHPIFLRLRRMREGANIVAYIEESLRNEGLIDRISDLKDVPNLVLILDGFDELVMASRARLRHFFNLLREELTTGPLRSARAIVSGRDTLFPNGDGLPVGAHVLTLVPFDAPRVAAWGKKWRALHKDPPGNNFQPERLLPDEKASSETPLQYLASWPLTLHLLARVHTEGILHLGLANGQEIEKAFLYRGIMADTLQRQMTKGEGHGRFDRNKLHQFLRYLAWEMYSRETDSLDFDDVGPVVKRFHPEATDAELAEITEAAIVNAPELTKGEQTGCEFVHKSFAEYLVAEHIAEAVEMAAFKAAQFGMIEPTWRMSDGDATTALASIFASRLLTSEVQEMFEPMLGCTQSFFGSDSVEDIRSSVALDDGLARIIERLEMMLGLLARGQHLDLVSKLGVENGLAGTALEAFANYCAGIMIVGTAAARRASRGSSKSTEQVYFNGEPVPGGFWRCIGLLEAGGLIIDSRLGARLFRQMTLASRRGQAAGMTEVSESDPQSEFFDESSFPVKLRELGRIHRYNSAATSLIDRLVVLTVEHLIAYLISSRIRRVPRPYYREASEEARRFEYEYVRYFENELERTMYLLEKTGLISVHDGLRYFLHDVLRFVTTERFETDSRDAIEELGYTMRRITRDYENLEYGQLRPYGSEGLLERIYYEWRQNTEDRYLTIRPPRDLDSPATD